CHHAWTARVALRLWGPTPGSCLRDLSEAHCALLYPLSPLLSGPPRGFRVALYLSFIEVSLLRTNPSSDYQFPSQGRFADKWRIGSARAYSAKLLSGAGTDQRLGSTF